MAGFEVVQHLLHLPPVSLEAVLLRLKIGSQAGFALKGLLLQVRHVLASVLRLLLQTLLKREEMVLELFLLAEQARLCGGELLRLFFLERLETCPGLLFLLLKVGEQQGLRACQRILHFCEAKCELLMILQDALLLAGDAENIGLADLGRDGCALVDDWKAYARQIAGAHKTCALILARALASNGQRTPGDGPANRDILDATHPRGVGDRQPVIALAGQFLDITCAVIFFCLYLNRLWDGRGRFHNVFSLSQLDCHRAHKKVCPVALTFQSIAFALPENKGLEQQRLHLVGVDVGTLQQNLDVVVGSGQGIVAKLLLNILDRRAGL